MNIHNQKNRKHERIIIVSRAFKLLSVCVRAMIGAKTEQQLLNDICRLIVEQGGYAMAWVGMVGHDDAKDVRNVAEFGRETGYLERSYNTWVDDEIGNGPTGLAIKTGKPQKNQDFMNNPPMKTWRDGAIEYGFQSSISLPLRDEQTTFGALTIYSPDPYSFSAEEVQLLVEIAGNLSFGILGLREQHKHKLLEEELKRESEKNMAFLHNASDGIHILDERGNIIEASNSFCAMLGYQRDQMIGMNVSQWDAKFTQAELGRKLKTMFEQDKRNQFETLHQRKDGSIFDVEVSSLPLNLHGMKVLFNSSRDIADRKKTETALRQSEILFRTMIEQSPIGISFSRDGYPIAGNAAYLQMFGYEDIAEMLDKPVTDHYAQQCRADIEDRIKRRLEGKPTANIYETIGQRKDGEQFPVLISAKAVKLEDGPTTVAYLIDFTERKEAEIKLAQSRQELQELARHLTDVREEERARIAREIHDELGQAFTVARVDLTRLSSRLQEPRERLRIYIESVISTIDQATDAARTISEDLRPGMLDVLGLGAAVEHHIKRFIEATGIPCRLNLNDHGGFDRNAKVATTAFRIVQESLTNIARHAQAKNVDIQIAELDKVLLLIVHDDGRGIQQEASDSKRRSYGLIGMRERVQSLGGMLSIDSHPGQGTRIEANLPIGLGGEETNDSGIDS